MDALLPPPLLGLPSSSASSPVLPCTESSPSLILESVPTWTAPSHTWDAAGILGVLSQVCLLFPLLPHPHSWLCLCFVGVHPVHTWESVRGGNFLEALHSYTHSCWARSRILCCGPFLLGILKSWCYYHLPLGVALEKVQPVLIPFPFIVVTCILLSGSFPSSIYLSFSFFSPSLTFFFF